jgi:hypothetical protein
MKDHRMPCSIITKACIEGLQQPWAPFNDDVKDKFDSNASPLGFSELTWIWEDSSSTWRNTFIVVDNAPCEVILGSADCQKPRTSPGGLYPTFLGRQSKGNL